jgi:hypothetical protein
MKKLREVFIMSAPVQQKTPKLKKIKSAPSAPAQAPVYTPTPAQVPTPQPATVQSPTAVSPTAISPTTVSPTTYTPTPPAPAPAQAPPVAAAPPPAPPPQYQQPVAQYPTQPAPAPAPAPAPQYPTPQPQYPAVQPTAVQPHAIKGPPVKKTKKTVPGRVGTSKKEKARYSQVRYRTRILKGSFLPILFAIMSFLLLRSYVYNFQDYFEYKTLLILFGFLLGFVLMSGITISNVLRAKKNVQNGIQLNVNVGLAVIIPVLAIVFILAFLLSLSDAWQFSIGFFAASIFPALFVIIFEFTSKKKFFIQESLTIPSEKRKLIAIPA